MKKILKKDNVIKTSAKAAITVSSMLAVNDILGYFAPTRASQTIHRIGNNIAGLSIGFLVGQIASDAVINSVERAIAAYNGETIYTEDK